MIGNFSPAGSIIGVTATPTGGGTAVNGTTTIGSYYVPGLPPGTYTLTYAVDLGYQVPAPQVVTITAGIDAQAPSLTVLLTGSTLPEHLTLGNPSGGAVDVS